ncbi:MAG: winged helix-turn-helix domain-containing protein [Chloroflexota bacterium]|nr:winged helix-turn-helix domain-containing protein [Chloroflexota bacterium]
MPSEPQDRLARMNEASIRITESLDLDAVLQGVVDAACSLTGARQGGVSVRDDEREPPTLITSGLTADEHEALHDMPGGLELFDYLSGLPEPLRVADFPRFARERSLPDVGPPVAPMGPFLSAPVRHLGRRVGNLFLSKQAGEREFTPEDEGLLALFSSQAALAIANASRYREEQRAKADLETLIDTSPVGVIVFAADSGALLSVNREALRITEGLRSPDQTPEELLEVLSFRRADGREISLQQFPLARALNTSETVRGEEIVILVPDGRQVKTIINSTPIRSPEGAVVSVVVTLQDLAPIEDLARQRIEFLSLVSQELLAPLTSIKGSTAAVLEDLSRLDIATARQFFGIIEWQADRMRGLIWDLLEVARIEAGALLLHPEPSDLAALLEQARASLPEAGHGNQVVLDLPDDLPMVAADRERALQLLDRLLGDAAARAAGAPVTVGARVEQAHVAITVSAGGGTMSFHVPAPRVLASSPLDGLDRANSGTALGLAVCRGIVEAHGGRIWIERNGAGAGSRCIFTLPVAEEAPLSRAGSPVQATGGGRRTTRGRGRVLVVVDDPQALWHIRQTLTDAGYNPAAALDPEEVERLIAMERPHLVLIDAALNEADDQGLIRRVADLTDAPVLLLAGQGANPQRELALAFEHGADDYIARPFSPTELVARAGAALRRREMPAAAPPQDTFQLGDLQIEYARRRVAVNGRELSLTDTEYRLLCELALNAGRPLSREQLMNRVWAAREPGDSGVVRAYVRRLRRKLGDSADEPRYIFNEPRIGYRLGAGETREDESETG